MDFGIASVASITVIAFLAGYTWKNISALDDKWIPCVCGALGLILGILAYIIKVPDFPADDIITAAAVGIVSGFAATGIHQIPKQLLKDSDKESDGPIESEEIEEEETTEVTETDVEDGPQ